MTILNADSEVVEVEDGGLLYLYALTENDNLLGEAWVSSDTWVSVPNPGWVPARGENDTTGDAE